jgi:hypothetical protein
MQNPVTHGNTRAIARGRLQDLKYNFALWLLGPTVDCEAKSLDKRREAKPLGETVWLEVTWAEIPLCASSLPLFGSGAGRKGKCKQVTEGLTSYPVAGLLVQKIEGRQHGRSQSRQAVSCRLTISVPRSSP